MGFSEGGGGGGEEVEEKRRKKKNFYFNDTATKEIYTETRKDALKNGEETYRKEEKGKGEGRSFRE